MLARVQSTDGPELNQLATRLKQLADGRSEHQTWVAEELAACGQAGVFEWFHRRESGGQAWEPRQVIQGYLALSRACLTTTFVLTQRTGACQRIEGSPNREFAGEWLPRLIRGDVFATVGISHLTTSRQHLGRAVLRATPTDRGWLLSGYSPWVTGSTAADLFVVGATLDEGTQVLLGVPRDLPGVQIPPASELLALQASQTGAVEFHEVEVPRFCLLQGPAENVLQRGTGAGTGGLQTTTLALGLAGAALDYLSQEAEQRAGVAPIGLALESEWKSLKADLLAVASGQPACPQEELRRRANSLVLRATQSALAVAKGAGFTQRHPVGRWCCEALFFLVWSCPQPVIDANLCEFAGLSN